ncbi:MAG: hypothetical protein JXA18_03975 [Chitinispirillaceae bacterium]|nr:hypothetical protein [Chitinispirillaceae bacterium]
MYHFIYYCVIIGLKKATPVDTMPTLDILFIILVSIMAVSVFLSIIDWIYLASLTSKTTILEREIEKKSLEFDALKKERYTTQHPSEVSASVIESTEPLGGDVALPIVGGEDTIQIVRNIRGNFERTEQSTHLQGSPREQSTISPPAASNNDIIEYAAAASFSAPEPYQGPTESTEAPNTIRGPSSAGTGKYPIQSTNSGGSFTETPGTIIPHDVYTLKLYSETTRDADFQTLWKKINGIFHTRQNPSILIDLSGINFMYDNEMDYLEKIKYLIIGRGGSFGFINCDRELLTLFNNRPELRSIAK